MNEKLTELVFIIDRSGSMAGMESDTIGGINAVLHRNRASEGDAVVSVVLFDPETEVLFDRVPIAQVPDLTERDYQVRGCTALLDAVGGGVRFIKRVQTYLPEDARPAKTIFVITTDGLENASTRYTYPQVKELLEKRQAEGWEFLFLGANIDAAAEAARIGIAPDRAETYYSDTAGHQAMYAAVAEATCVIRDAAPAAARMGSGWKKSILRDRARRK
jgi:Mg-chelatase subunit ChlD